MNYLANKKIPFGQMERRRIKRAILWLLQQKAILAATNRFNKNEGEKGISDLRKFKVSNVRLKLVLLVLDYVNKDNQLKE